MGCGLSHMNRVHRIKVLDATLSKDADQTSETPSAPVNTRRKTLSIPTTSAPSVPTRPTKPRPLARTFKPTNPQTPSPASHKSPPPSISAPLFPGLTAAAQTPDPATVPPAALVEGTESTKATMKSTKNSVEQVVVVPVGKKSSGGKDVFVSRVSVKSFSDQDSGYKDDAESSTPEYTSDSDMEAVSRKRTRPRRKAPDILVKVQSDDHTAPAATDILDDDIFDNVPDGDTEELHNPGLCQSCGYCHAKQDGYVETYDDGFVDSSYEELRSLTHEGSVFSLDILCHNTMDGAHRPQKIPLHVHRPVPPAPEFRQREHIEEKAGRNAHHHTAAHQHDYHLFQRSTSISHGINTPSTHPHPTAAHSGRTRRYLHSASSNGSGQGVAAAPYIPAYPYTNTVAFMNNRPSPTVAATGIYNLYAGLNIPDTGRSRVLKKQSYGGVASVYHDINEDEIKSLHDVS